jgi:hypothetical protein
MTKLWFKAKRYGWGWTPVTWEGWLVVILYIAFVLWFAFVFTDQEQRDGNLLVNFGFGIVVPTALLIWICYKKGEKPRWSWGDSKSDKETKK